MKNLKVSAKLITGFLIIAMMTVIVGITGIIGMRQINNSLNDMYHLQTVPLPELSKVIEMLQRQRVCMREYIIGAGVGDIELIEDVNNRAQNYRQIMHESMDLYRETIQHPEALVLFEEAVRLYEVEFLPGMDRVYHMAMSGTDPVELYHVMASYTEITNLIVEKFDRCMSLKVELAAQAAQTAENTARILLILIIAALFASLLISVLLALYISGLISKPLKILSEFMTRSGSTGDIAMRPEDAELISNMRNIKDEIGQTIVGAASFVKHVTMISNELESIADGDLAIEVNSLSESDVMGKSLSKMIDNLNAMFSEINTSTTQVSTGARQVSEGAQALAKGATEQAASIEELSGAITEIAARTKTNAETADKTSKLSREIKESAEKGSRQMEDMILAVKDINEASNSIRKIIKTIDDIAFQTNILALNAAVEAARAGQHGKGFAVVAEEVRNLASKSAAAAKDTGNMIQNSMDKAELGSRIAGETAESLKEIVLGINETSQLITEIALASEEQSTSIKQINVGIDQVASVVQQNSATAQQSAAASEQLSGQSLMLENLIGQFKLKEFAVNQFGIPSAKQKYALPAPSHGA